MRKPYTLKEIVEMDFPEFWGGANESIRIAKELQNLSMKLLALFKNKLPSDFKQLKSNATSQLIVFNYLKYRSMYGLAHEICSIVDNQCRLLAKSSNEADYDNVEVAKSELVSCFSFVEKFVASLDVVGDYENGFNNLEGIIDTYKTNLDFGVMWNLTYRDITGIIKYFGGLHERL